MPNGVTHVGKQAFSHCYALANVAIPGSVKNIEDDVFRECRELVNVVIPDGVEVIGNFAFGNCRSLACVMIPASVTVVEMNAFMECSGLRYVTMLGNVTSIGKNAFSECTRLENVRILGSTANMSIGPNAFDGCGMLRNVDAQASETSAGNTASPAKLGDAVRRAWECGVEALPKECCTLLKGEVANDEGRRENVAIMLQIAFAILPKEWNISNERDTGQYFQQFCNCLGLTSPTSRVAQASLLKGAHVDLETQEAFRFEFTYGRSSNDALKACESQNFGKYQYWGKVHVFGINYNPQYRNIDKPFSSSYNRSHVPNRALGPCDEEYALFHTSRDECGRGDDICPMGAEEVLAWLRQRRERKAFERQELERKERERNERERGQRAEREKELEADWLEMCRRRNIELYREREQAYSRGCKDPPMPVKVIINTILLVLVFSLIRACSM